MEIGRIIEILTEKDYEDNNCSTDVVHHKHQIIHSNGSLIDTRNGRSALGRSEDRLCEHTSCR